MLKRYDIKSDAALREGWAIIVIDTDIGFFATVSDWGNYSYIWSSPGCEFRKFLCGLEVDYLRGKLLMGRGKTKVFDRDATVNAIEEAIKERVASMKERGQNRLPGTGVGIKTWAAGELKILSTYPGMDEREFEAWQSETTLDEPWDYGVWGPDHQSTQFCERVMPRFKKMLEEELKMEEMQKPKAERPEHLCCCNAVEGVRCPVHERPT